MEEQEEKKVIVKLKKVPLQSEREEIREKRKHKFSIFLLCLFIFVAGLGIGGGFVYGLRSKGYLPHSDNKYDAIKEYLGRAWLYKNDYEDLDSYLDDKAYAGMTFFDFDPYTSYMSVDEMKEYYSSINMNYVGIGVQYYLLNDVATITRVFKGSPAETAGILDGDIIVAVDGNSIEGLSSDDIKNAVVGEEGTNVVITVKRAGIEQNIVVTRGTVDSTVYARANDDYVILEIMSFGETTTDEVVKYLNDYQNYSKLIIDLRDNGGGYQTAVQGVASLFLGSDKIVMRQVYADGYEEITNTINGKYFDNFKNIIILTNGSTASAAEVLVMALKEGHENCISLGETTYGKGVVQTPYRLQDGSIVKITTSEWMSPSGKSINNEGIKPDIEVKLNDIFYQRALPFEKDDVYEFDQVSESIKIAQLSLDYLGYDVKRKDGYFDEDFLETLLMFKQDHDLTINNKLDYDTYKEIISEVSITYALDENADPQLNKAKELLNDD